ncbi:hypothetical protein GYMLUDRAFT_553210 [Collybiopsis luxurians FD-317 M1]|uniref:Uncharacterized protein n=1 Tax=Collybiopsis luxurians FD-317 M1 TaxID=944289 RepID=A0A0D0BEJ0_9AGAR|nr:hypothetical protein GYMLUDRAFT_553210 [Collybiopsis luxurians FD-317 M1]
MDRPVMSLAFIVIYYSAKMPIANLTKRRRARKTRYVINSHAHVLRAAPRSISTSESRPDAIVAINRKDWSLKVRISISFWLFSISERPYPKNASLPHLRRRQPHPFHVSIPPPRLRSQRPPRLRLPLLHLLRVNLLPQHRRQPSSRV